MGRLTRLTRSLARLRWVFEQFDHVLGQCLVRPVLWQFDLVDDDGGNLA
jgi:hypothetical protein